MIFCFQNQNQYMLKTVMAKIFLFQFDGLQIVLKFKIQYSAKSKLHFILFFLLVCAHTHIMYNSTKTVKNQREHNNIRSFKFNYGKRHWSVSVTFCKVLVSLLEYWQDVGTVYKMINVQSFGRHPASNDFGKMVNPRAISDAHYST